MNPGNANLQEILWSAQAAQPWLLWLQVLPFAGAGLVLALGERRSAVTLGKLLALAGGDKVTFEQAKLKTRAEGIEGEVSLRQEKGWQDLSLKCEVQGPQVTRLTWQPLPGANKPQ
jgi:hypothetical protein